MARKTRRTSKAAARPPVRKGASKGKSAPPRPPARPPARHRRKKSGVSAARGGAATSAAAARLGAMSKAEVITLLEWVHGFTTKMADSWPGEHVAFQSAPTDNHLLWTLGHLATTYAWGAGMLTGTMLTLPEKYNELFGYKSVVKAGSGAYPSLAEVRRHMDAAYEGFLSAVRSQSESDLAKPCAMDTGGFASSRMDAILKLCWHDGWHQGQLSSLRRALSLPSLM